MVVKLSEIMPIIVKIQTHDLAYLPKWKYFFYKYLNTFEYLNNLKYLNIFEYFFTIRIIIRIRIRPKM